MEDNIVRLGRYVTRRVIANATAAEDMEIQSAEGKIVRVMEMLEQAEKKDMNLADRLRSALNDIAELIRETIEAYLYC